MAVNYFLKVDGIDGESMDKQHAKEIQLITFGFGVSQTGSFEQGGGGGAGKANFQDFSFTMRVNKSSPKWYLYCANGKHIKSAVLTLVKAGEKPQDYCTYTFTDLLVSSFATSGDSQEENDTPTDTVSINFAQMVVEYKEQNKDGSLGAAVKTGWNIQTNSAP